MPVVETFAYSSFLRNHEDLTAFYLLTLNPTFNIWSGITPEQANAWPATQKDKVLAMASIADKGKRVAAHLATVYLATIMEAYVKDAVYELLNDKIRRVNSQLLGDPIPTTESEDIMIDLEIETRTRMKQGLFTSLAPYQGSVLSSCFGETQ